MADNDKPSSGVQELIERIHEEGVEAGEEKAKRIVDEAHDKAASIVEEAEDEAERKKKEAKEAAEAEQKAAKSALEQAARDTLLAVKESLEDRLRDQIRRMLSERLDDGDLLTRLVLEIANKERPDEDRELEVLLPDRPLTLGELSEQEGEADPVDRFVQALAKEGLEEGVEIRAGEHTEAGLRIRLEGGDVEIDLTERALTELLSQHLLPRFRGLLDGTYRR